MAADPLAGDPRPRHPHAPRPRALLFPRDAGRCRAVAVDEKQCQDSPWPGGFSVPPACFFPTPASLGRNSDQSVGVCYNAHMNQYKKVSIVIPVYNERGTIEQVLREVKSANTFGLEKEIILVDDFSTDGTRDFLKSLNDPELKIFLQEKNTGKGGALHKAFDESTGDIVIVQDADLEYDPKEIEKVLEPFIKFDAQVVYGSRYIKPSQNLGFWHSFFNKLFTHVSNILIGQKITDIMTCYKAFSRPALESFLKKLESQRFGFEPEVTARVTRAGYKIIEVPISYQPRSHYEGKHMNLKGQVDSLKALIKYSLFR